MQSRWKWLSVQVVVFFCSRATGTHAKEPPAKSRGNGGCVLLFGEWCGGGLVCFAEMAVTMCGCSAGLRCRMKVVVSLEEFSTHEILKFLSS